MDESLRLQQSLRQQQTLAPMQLQLVRMLEMNAPEIEEEVRRALDENPALEVKSDEVSATAEEFSETAEQLQLADYRSDEDVPFYRYEARNSSADDPRYEPIAVERGESLMDTLMAQIGEIAGITPRQRAIARTLIGNIDDNGYITRSMSAIADDLAIQEEIDVSSAEVKEVWQLVRSLDPAGIAAVDLRDSLLLQLRRRPSSADTALAIEIVSDYFDLFSLMHFDRIRSLTGADAQQLRQAMEVIRSLDPKPGSQYSSSDDRTRHIIPDFLVEADDENQRLTLTLLNRLPQLQIEQSFASDTPISSAPSRRADTANAFIRQKRDEAASFIRVLETRQTTLFRVMSAIMQWQRQFFLTDDQSTLRPMILKDIAEQTGDDMSVISRATAGKYVATRAGVYPLKFFFNERMRQGDADVSSRTISERLRSIIKAEDKRRPLSDLALTNLLKEEGYDVARRTVTKYRERMGIPVARLRRGLPET